MKTKLKNLLKSIFNFELIVPSFKIHIGSLLIGIMIISIFSYIAKIKQAKVYVSKHYEDNRNRFVKL